MGVRTTGNEGKVALFDSVTGLAFGYVFDNEEEANKFLDWYNRLHGYRDLRTLSPKQLEDAFQEFFSLKDSVWYR